ncbi:MAG TPA: hypothetical protein EYP21_02740 [Syntrophaceae bacterium]|nr:hypothetical protein [Syntrophaceae bacterium]
MESGNAKRRSKRRGKGRSRPQSDSALVTRIKEKQKLLRYLCDNYIPHLLPQLDFEDPKMKRITDNIVNYRPVREEFSKKKTKEKANH